MAKTKRFSQLDFGIFELLESKALLTAVAIEFIQPDDQQLYSITDEQNGLEDICPFGRVHEVDEDQKNTIDWRLNWLRTCFSIIVLPDDLNYSIVDFDDDLLGLDPNKLWQRPTELVFSVEYVTPWRPHNTLYHDTYVGQFTPGLLSYVDYDFNSARPAIIGDSNYGGVFDQLDNITDLAGGRYGSGERATWEQGDWNRDGFFDQYDIVVSMQANTNLQPRIADVIHAQGPTLRESGYS